MIDVRPCPRCGAEAARRPGLDALCPACLLRVGFAPPDDGSDADVWDPPSPADLIGKFPDLEPVRLLGRGGMAAVYEARQRGLDRRVALKILSPRLARDPAFVERFQREARMLASLDHPGIVTIHDTGRVGDFLYLVMEFVDGPNLRDVRRDGPPEPRRAVEIVAEACDALEYAHARGIVHRDVKPENLLLDRVTGRVKVADFGLAKLLRPDARDPALTVTHTAVGTPQYMAPEQYETPASVDARTDVYAAGVVLYELLTGTLPVGRFAAPSHRAAVAVDLDEVVLGALEGDPEKRIASAGELARRLRSVTVAVPVSSRRRARSAAVPVPRVGVPLAADVLAGVRIAIVTAVSWWVASSVWGGGAAAVLAFALMHGFAWGVLAVGKDRTPVGLAAPRIWLRRWAAAEAGGAVAVAIVGSLLADAWIADRGRFALLAPSADEIRAAAFWSSWAGVPEDLEITMGGFTSMTGGGVFAVVALLTAAFGLLCVPVLLAFAAPRPANRRARMRYAAVGFAGVLVGSLAWHSGAWIGGAEIAETDLGIPLPAWGASIVEGPRADWFVDAPLETVLGRIDDWATSRGYRERDEVHASVRDRGSLRSSLWAGTTVFSRWEHRWGMQRAGLLPFRVDAIALAGPSGDETTHVRIRAGYLRAGRDATASAEGIVEGLRRATLREH